MTIQEAILSVRERIGIARAKAGRQDPVCLIGISKTHPAELIREAWNAGLADFGENRVQEALPKISAVQSGSAIVWHLVGHLQSNKVNKAAPVFDWVHSIDSVETAAHLHRAARAAGRRIHALVEVNTSGEESKHGIAPGDAAAFTARLHEALAEDLENTASENGVILSGLMTIGPLGGREAENRRAFALLREIRERLCGEWPLCRELSMGMSGDFESAILEGATMVRVGGAIFGARS
ncbi:MAG: YggS family pyridoxal phosphate-dependent enzyme [Spirochaetota bacterium]|jgi:pyridoxal phosphate enzyme (YggS family)|nr:YggS family pyridoxal phosphate-dependent enzyme [Spirochaetota bacterium]